MCPIPLPVCRPLHVFQVLVLVTDGQSHDTIDTFAAAANLKANVSDLTVLVVGVGNDVGAAEWLSACCRGWWCWWWWWWWWSS